MKQDRSRQANLLYGMAELHLRRQELSKAKQALLQAIALDPDHYLNYHALGKICYEEKEFPSAIQYLNRARLLNPFNEETNYYLALAYYYAEAYESALPIMMDAVVLSGELNAAKSGSVYGKKLQLILEKLPALSRSQRNQMLKERQHHLQQQYEKLQSQIQRVSPALLNRASTVMPEQDNAKHIELLKRFLIFKNLKPQALQLLLPILQFKKVAAKALLYKEQENVQGLFIITSGSIRLYKSTPLGNLEMAHVKAGQFFGDDELMLSSHYNHCAAADANPAELILLPREALLELFAADKHLALHFYWFFWKSLAFQIRQANDQLKHFFTHAKKSSTSPNLAMPQQQRKSDLNFHLALHQKQSLLQEQGLSSEELQLLAKVCSEEIYNPNEIIFRENDPGDKLYIIVSGAVLITKHIDGIGDEALAVLKKGDFFGELALIDDLPRSAQAKAHQHITTVLAIKKSALQEILAMDVGSACHFLAMLYKILYLRLREIREKIYQWKIMAGGF